MHPITFGDRNHPQPVLPLNHFAIVDEAASFLSPRISLDRLSPACHDSEANDSWAWERQKRIAGRDYFSHRVGLFCDEMEFTDQNGLAKTPAVR